MKKSCLGLFICIFSILCGCSNSNDVQSAPKDVRDFAETFIKNLVSEDTLSCFNKIDGKLLSQQTKLTIAETGDLLKTENVKNAELIHYELLKSSKKQTQYIYLQYAYTFDHDYALFSIFLKKDKNQYLVEEFNKKIQTQDPAKQFQFNLINKGIYQYLFLLLMIIVPAFILITLVVAIRTPLQRKWLWITFIFLGFVSFSMNLATGLLYFKLVSIQLFSIGAVKLTSIGPWMLSVSIPAGAIAFWLKWIDLKREAAAESK